jgi:hypothetical protein
MENTNNTINKPLPLIVNELNQAIVNIINNSRLPMTIIEMEMRSLYNEVSQKAREEYERAKVEYEKALAEQIKAEEPKEATEK